MARITTLLGFGAGYVLGTRAGRERYEQIKNGAQQLTQRPEVQQLKEKATGVAQSGLQSNSSSSGSGGPTAALKNLAAKARSRRQGSSGDLGSGYGATGTGAYGAASTGTGAYGATGTGYGETSYSDEATVLSPEPVDLTGTGTSLDDISTDTTPGTSYTDRP